MEPNELPVDLASIRYLPTYTSPTGYFDSLTDEIMSQINLPELVSVPLSKPPVHYFEGLSEAILDKIKIKKVQVSKSEAQMEIEEIDPFLASISRVNVYQTPAGYFDSLSIKTHEVKSIAPVKKLFRAPSWITSAAAAIITGFIALSILFITNENRTSDTGFSFTGNYTKELSKVPDNEISDYLSSVSHDIEIIPSAQDGSNTMDAESIYKKLLNNVSDNEIQDYLNENDGGDEKNIKGI